MRPVEIEDAEQHERVAKALEQINGLRYRYRGAGAKAPKKNIDDDSDEANSTDSEESDLRAEAKSRAGSARVQPRKSNAPLSLDDHIERMLLHTRTIALLKIATNTAEVLPDGDDDEDEEEDEEEEFVEYDEDDENGFSTSRTDEDVDADEKSDQFESDASTPPLMGSKASSMRRIGSTRRVSSFRSNGSSFRGDTASDHEAAAALRLVRKLSTFLSLPKVISYKDLEEITESLLDDPHDESEEYAHLIDEHIDSARDSTGDDSSVTASSGNGRLSSSSSLAVRRMTSQRSLASLNIHEDPTDLELQQRRLYVENAALRRYSSKNVIGMSTRNLLGRGASQRGLGSHGSLRQLGSSLTASSRDLLAHTESRRTLTRDPSSRSIGRGGPGSIASLPEDKEQDDDDAEEKNAAPDAGVYGTMFDEHGYKQWRTDIKEDYLAWIRAKVEAKKLRKLQKQKEAEKKPRWQLLYEAASSKRREPDSDAEETVVVAPRKGNSVPSPAAATTKSTRASVV